jgi:hypothetical protein
MTNRKIDFDALSKKRLTRMLNAGEEVFECNRVLHKINGNIVNELIKDVETFYEFDHYPDGDVYDSETDGQYYYHAHRPESGEHGHFHTFIRDEGIPEKIKPVKNDSDEKWPSGDDTICHLIAISMDNKGFPTQLFTTNRWVTDENWYTADDTIALLDRFEIDHAWPSWPTNRWITAMIAFFHPQIELLIRERDIKVDAWRKKNLESHVFEDRDLEITSIMGIDIDKQQATIREPLKGKK